MTSPLLIIPLFTLAATLAAGISDPTPGVPNATDREAWVGRIADAHRSVTDAERRLEDARANYGRMKARRKARGERRETIRTARNEAAEDLARAEHHLENLLEEARRAGVPPGWIREGNEASTQHPAALP